jgi:hypothetical protein
MGTFGANVGLGGNLMARKVNQSPTLSWRIRHALSWERVKGLAGFMAGKHLGKWFGFGTFISELKAVHIDGATGKRTNYGVVSRRLVTTAWVNFLVDNLQAETTEFGDLKFHDSGVGVTGATIGDTDIETTDGESRVTGTQTEGATANIYKSVGTITYTTSKAITEHGIFTIVTGGTMADRHTFTAINVVNTDQIEFTYEMTYSAGG